MVNRMNREEIIKMLYAAADDKHKNYNAAIITTVDKDRFIGVRTPKLRAMAVDMLGWGNWHNFIADVPHHFFEENQLHAFIISEIYDFDFVVHAVDEFLPYIDNWATCDQMSPKIFAEKPEKLLPYIRKWIKSKHEYTVRFAIVCLMRYFLTEKFNEKYAKMVARIKSKEYYVNMAQAWYFATAAAKQFDAVYPYFADLNDWVLLRAIEKAISSYRVSGIHKLQLKRLRRRMQNEQFDPDDEESSFDIQTEQDFAGVSG